MNKIRVAIFGGSGYGGSELLRILLFHPHVEVVFVTAHEQAGKAVGEVHRNLHGLTELSFVTAPETVAGVDCVFLALPPVQAMDVVPHLPAHVKAIDLSGDFRLRDQAVCEKNQTRKQPAIATHAPRRNDVSASTRPPITRRRSFRTNWWAAARVPSAAGFSSSNAVSRCSWA